MYASSGRHIADDMLSEHTACVYKARMLPVAVLEEKVGSHVLVVRACMPVLECSLQSEHPTQSLQWTCDWSNHLTQMACAAM